MSPSPGHSSALSVGEIELRIEGVSLSSLDEKCTLLLNCLGSLRPSDVLVSEVQRNQTEMSIESLVRMPLL